MRTRTKTPLDIAGWRALSTGYREARAAILRVRHATAITTFVDESDHWAVLWHRAGRLAQRLVDDHAYAQLGEHSRAADLFRDPGERRWRERPRYDWAVADGNGNRKRRLTREEWVAMGDDVKLCRAAFTAIGLAVQGFAPKTQSRPWFALVDRVDRLKCRLDSLAYRQHPDWEEFSLVFYGKPSALNLRLVISMEGP
jgi:hypothetical protein